MIVTRFGSEVKVIGGNIEKGEIDVIRTEDGSRIDGYIVDFKADNGIAEIIDAINATNENQ